MPRRKYGLLTGKCLLEGRTKRFLQELGYSSFEPFPIIGQLPPNDLKIKYPKDYNPSSMDFKHTVTKTGGSEDQFEYIIVKCPKYNFRFIIYISEKLTWRAYVPTKGNSFCKKRKKVYGFCGCHSEDFAKENAFSGSFDEEIKKRMQKGDEFYDNVFLKVKNWDVRKGPKTTEWEGEESLNNSTDHSVKRARRHFEKIGLVKDIAWSVLEFVGTVDVFKFRSVCKLWNIIVQNEVFQKRRWETDSKRYESQWKENDRFWPCDFLDEETYCTNNHYFGLINDHSEQNMMILPNFFKLQLDGTFESLYYTKKNEKTKKTTSTKSYYHLNLSHVISQSFCSGFEGQYNLPRTMYQDRSASMLPYPIHEAVPKPVIIDLSQEYDKRSLEEVKKYSDEKDVPTYNSRDTTDLCSDWVEQTDGADRDVLMEIIFDMNDPCLDNKNTLAKKVITKMLRSTHEFEYFDHNAAETKSKKYPILKIPKVSKKTSTTTRRRRNVKVSVEKERLEEYSLSFLYDVDKVWRVRQLVNRVKANTKNPTIFLSFTSEVERRGFVWIVGEKNGYLIGVTMRIFGNYD